MSGKNEDEVVMTPLKTTGDRKVIRIEHMKKKKLNKKHVQHFAGGPFQGIVINKSSNDAPDKHKPEASKDFVVHLGDPNDSQDPDRHLKKEKRIIRFWYLKEMAKDKHEETADEFFKKLLDPDNFPRDYISFLKRAVTEMKDYTKIKKIELEMRPPTKEEEEDVAKNYFVKEQKTFSYVTTTTTTVNAGDPGASQEDYRLHQDGRSPGEHGTVQNGEVMLSQSATPLGATRDQAGRRGPSQEDRLRNQDGSVNATHGDIENDTSVTIAQRATPLGATHNQADRRGPSQEDHLRNQDGSFNISHGNIQKETSVTISQRATPLGAARDQATRQGPDQDDHLKNKDSSFNVTQSSIHDPGAVDALYSKLQPGAHHDTTDSGKVVKHHTTEDRKTEHGPDGVTITTVKKTTTYSTHTTRSGPRVAPKPKYVISEKGHMLIWIAKKQKLLNILEDAYPNPIQSEELVRLSGFKKGDVVTIAVLLKDLQNRGLINEMDKGRWMRIQKAEPKEVVTKTKAGKEETKKVHEIKVVDHIPVLKEKEQPTIAVITAWYCEKVAVDAMMDTKTTYVRYKTEGEAQVYTVGTIGGHNAVSTKLSRIGFGQGAMVSAGNVVTRLLGTFGRVEHVILVGVGGGIVNYKDDTKHVRLGDVVSSKPEWSGGQLYIHCTDVDTDPHTQSFNFGTANWSPVDEILVELSEKMRDEYASKVYSPPPWEKYLTEGLEHLERGDLRFYRPDAATDRLFRVIDGKRQEVQHPTPAFGSFRARNPDKPMVHYGCIATGKQLIKDEGARADFALVNEVKAIDSGFQAVMESIEGNRKDSFFIIRGISDYDDGIRKKEWQPYAALAAAAYMKALLVTLPVPEADDD